jgi:hypothetical protein
MASLVNNGCYMKGSGALTPPAYGTAGMAGEMAISTTILPLARPGLSAVAV